MNISDIVVFLQQKTCLGNLSAEILSEIASLVSEQTVAANEVMITENTEPDGLYIIQTGTLASDSQLESRQSSLLSGTVLNLYALLLEQPTQYTIKTISETKVWFINSSQFQNIVEQYPEITQAFSQQLAAEIKELSSQLQFEQERQEILRPYLVSKAKRGVIGKSRYSTRLRSQIKQASETRESVLLFGEPGLEKDNLAALIHFGSAYRRQPIIKVDCGKLQTSGAELFGRSGGKPGFIASLGEGTLILNNIQQLPSELLPAIATLIETKQYTPVTRPGGEVAEPQTSQARIILISEQTVPQIDAVVDNLIKVPPLRVRKADLEEQVNYYLNLIGRNKCLNKTRITSEAVRKLQAYDFPNNLSELENIIERAITQLQGCDDITEEIVWQSQSKKKQYRLNLLNKYPKLRYFLRSDWFPDRINYGFTFGFFAFIVLVLFIAPQNRQENFALNLFWAWWWPLILIGFPFVGRLWCAVCPFMIYGEITQKLSLILFPRKLKRWPRSAAELWGGWFLFGLFALILLWEELWDLENTAYLSACLLLLITAGAMIFSAIFERRFWCRYLCPIGGMNGLFAKLSMTELRAQQGTCSAECTTYQCYKGGAAKGEGQETNGCPLYSHPAQLTDNRDCVLCMTCLKACPHRSVEFNLRPPGIELWTTHTPRSYEVALLFLLLNVVFLHHLPEISTRLGLDFHLEQFSNHALVSIVVLSLPLVLPLLAQSIIQLIGKLNPKYKPRQFIELAYGYLPLVLAGNLAHYLQLGLGEGGKILPVTMATFGLDGTSLPVLVAHPAVIAFLQGCSLIFGVLLSILLTQKIARQQFKFLLPQHMAIIALAIGMWEIIVGF
ncbi:sigma 54-interacting transcriptional regulator [Pleurocapsa sp. PCC 7319]|uniref:sigma 54-interacting transcriptional regulator n=1 Tax=Pleurocapsa sp. PCC 7319 TaxID=118161 RepID=UPI0003489D3B|nr:sigma 54-interacting transcriptional regulator [Pleurocapsa sp. PCC 7319]